MQDSSDSELDPDLLGPPTKRIRRSTEWYEKYGNDRSEEEEEVVRSTLKYKKRNSTSTSSKMERRWGPVRSWENATCFGLNWRKYEGNRHRRLYLWQFSSSVILVFSSTDVSVYSGKSPVAVRKWDSGVLDIGYSSGENSLLDVITDPDLR